MMKYDYRIISFLLITLVNNVLDATPRSRHLYEEYNPQAMMQEMKSSLDQLRYAESNHENEIRIFEEKLNNYDAMLDSLRRELDQGSQAQKEFVKETSHHLETRIESLENAIKGILADLRQFKTYTQDTVASLSKNNQQLGELEKTLTFQSQQIENLQVALRSLMEVFQVKNEIKSKSYRVKAGDSLEKIARQNQTTIQVLKELNGLTNDRIIVGQTIQLPEKNE